MSAAATDKVNWLRKHYEQILVVLMLVGLLISALILVVQIQSARKDLAEARWEQPTIKPKLVEPADVEGFSKSLQEAHNPEPPAAYTHDLMVSELRVLSVNPDNIPAPIPYDAKVCPFTQHPQPEIVSVTERDTDLDGMKDGIETKYGFDPRDPSDAAMDSDQDGFTNLEEILYGAHPKDNKIFPDPPAKLRLVGAKREPFVMNFAGVQNLGSGLRFLLNVKSDEQSYFAKLDDEIEGYRVKAYREEGPNGAVLVLEKDGDTVELTKGQRRVDRYEWVAGLIFLIDKQKFRVHIGDTIELKGRAYKVVDIKKGAVSLFDPVTRKSYKVEKWSEWERNEVLGVSNTGGRLGGPPSRAGDKFGSVP